MSLGLCTPSLTIQNLRDNILFKRYMQKPKKADILIGCSMLKLFSFV